MDESNDLNESDAHDHSRPLAELAEETRKLVDGHPVYHDHRGERDRHIDLQAIREVMYALHDVSIGTHQLLYFAAMKYCKNYFDAAAADLEEAVTDLADIFETMNLGTLTIREQNGPKTILELSESAIAFDAGTDKPICYFTSGYIAGYLENALDTRYVVNEISCTSQGHDCCTFRAQKR